MADHCVLHHYPPQPKHLCWFVGFGLTTLSTGRPAGKMCTRRWSCRCFCWPSLRHRCVVVTSFTLGARLSLHRTIFIFSSPGPLWALALLRNSAAPQSQMLQVELQPRAAVLTAIILSALTVSVSEIRAMTLRPCENRMRDRFWLLGLRLHLNSPKSPSSQPKTTPASHFNWEQDDWIKQKLQCKAQHSGSLRSCSHNNLLYGPKADRTKLMEVYLTARLGRTGE